MKSNKINYLAVGSFVVAMFVGLIAAVALLTGRTGATDTYYSVYNNVTGVKFGTQVLYEGYPIGQVEGVTPVQEGGRMRFRVDLSVTAGWTIPDDSVAEIAAPGLLSAITVNIHAGDSQTALAPGRAIKGRPTSNMFAVMSSVAADIGELADTSLKPLLDTINRAVGSFGTLLESDGNALVKEMTRLTADLGQRAPRIVETIETFVGKISVTTDEIRTLVNPENRTKLEGIITNMEEAAKGFVQLSRDLEATRRSFDALVASTNSMVVGSKPDVERSVGDFRFVMDSLARRIESMSQNLEGASRNMYEFTRQIRQNPGLLLGSTPPPDSAAPR